MTQATEVLTELQRRGVKVVAEGDTLCLRPRRALDDTLLARVREAKAAILQALQNGQTIAPIAACGSPYCAGCYDVGDGKKIHPPRCGEKYLEWLKRWEPRGRSQ